MTQALTVYRRSQIEDSDCLHRWNQIWNVGVDDSSDYSLRGQAFAKIKHVYIERLLAIRAPQDEEEARQAFVEGIALHQTPQRLIPELRELWLRHAEWFALDLDRFLTAEERQEGDGLSFSPDLVYAHPEELEVVDDKTFWVCLTEVEAQASFQARFYIREAMKRWPHFPSYRFTFSFVRFHKTVSVTFKPSELEALDLEVGTTIARLRHAAETNQWPAVAGPSCRFCELRCPIADEPMRLPVRLSSPQAPQVAAWILTADKMVKGMKKALKAYCAANGPVLVGDVEFNNRPVTSRQYPVGKLLEVLAARNLMGAFESEGLTISASALSKLFKQFPKLEEDLAPYVKAKDSYRFGAKRPGEGEGEDE